MNQVISFGSDNHSGVHPLLMDEIVRANENFSPAYGLDPYSQNLNQWIKDHFDAVDSVMVFNGTAANVLCLQLATQSYHSVLVSECSHLNVDECGAPEKIAGCKLIPLPHQNGKIAVRDLEKALIRRGDQHFSQVQLVSITQPTELGTVYSLQEIAQIKNFCEQNNLYLHIDGARLANAAVTLGVDLKSFSQHCDLLSFGGAKNGLMLGEMVIVRREELAQGIKFLRKQSLQLPSKARFFSAPFLKYLESGLWKEIAHMENQLALELRQQLEATPNVQLTRPTQANGVFCQLPKHIIKPLRKKFFFYVWDEETFEVRLMTSFATQREHIDQFTSYLKSLFKERGNT